MSYSNFYDATNTYFMSGMNFSLFMFYACLLFVYAYAFVSTEYCVCIHPSNDEERLC